jgi:hypothetical protein
MFIPTQLSENMHAIYFVQRNYENCFIMPVIGCFEKAQKIAHDFQDVFDNHYPAALPVAE